MSKLLPLAVLCLGATAAFAAEHVDTQLQPIQAVLDELTEVTRPPMATSGYSNLTGPNVTYGNYSLLFGPTYADVPFAMGVGESAAVSTTAELEAILLRFKSLLDIVLAVNASIYSTDCLASTLEGMPPSCGLSSWEELYSSLPTFLQPAAAPFWNSDAAFAYERLSALPAFLEAVSSEEDLPFSAAEVVGLDQIINNTDMTLPELIAAGRVLKTDYFKYAQHVDPAPGSFLEMPTAVFFLDGPPDADPIELSLMPLAIRFHLQNSNTYSPQDDAMDWFLAKAWANMIDRDLTAVLHYVETHFALENICLAAAKHLPLTHPLFQLVDKACKLNSGLILTGIQVLLPPTVGEFDQILAISGPGIANKTIPFFASQYDWNMTYPEAEMAARGVLDLPGYLYRDDVLATHRAFSRYATSLLVPTYMAPGSVEEDAGLQAFLSDLSNSSLPTYLEGFPSPGDVQTGQDVADIAAQVMWLAGTRHHALNSDRLYNYDIVYPHHPAKITAAMPEQKGTLTEDDVVQKYIAPPVVDLTSPAGEPEYAPRLAANVSQVPYPLFLLDSFKFAYQFKVRIHQDETLSNGYLLLPVSQRLAQDAAFNFSMEMKAISQAIFFREAFFVTPDGLLSALPDYTLVAPDAVPYYTFV